MRYSADMNVDRAQSVAATPLSAARRLAVSANFDEEVITGWESDGQLKGLLPAIEGALS